MKLRPRSNYVGPGRATGGRCLLSERRPPSLPCPPSPFPDFQQTADLLCWAGTVGGEQHPPRTSLPHRRPHHEDPVCSVISRLTTGVLSPERSSPRPSPLRPSVFPWASLACPLGVPGGQPPPKALMSTPQRFNNNLPDTSIELLLHTRLTGDMTQPFPCFLRALPRGTVPSFFPEPSTPLSWTYIMLVVSDAQ